MTGGGPWAAVVLAGGAGRRLGGTDKPALVVGGQTLLERSVAAAAGAGAAQVVVVGPRRDLAMPVTWTREDPPGGGPLAGLVAGLAALEPAPDTLLVLAADLPRVSSALVGRLLAGLEPDADAVAVVDAGGWVQPLVAVYRAGALRAALDAVGDPRNRPVRALLERLRVTTLPDEDGAADIDTPGDLARWRP
ncbi:molybdenum cofactor guanylyltransferase [Jiangella alkaliphila]|uniref:Probable molybdenum cofactor guanylyltransferase n=1 Tax=Jiangella alkaliphila TaxID=419479 RepID=A0A1H2HCR2_9ACTN|nr:NTP transferase domain-containing protein [Jiangella alkaliphila]SDU29650.1 Molybdopterin-guanine dinucleotide biosynthesis protein A [Jiangella alkaliphila]